MSRVSRTMCHQPTASATVASRAIASPSTSHDGTCPFGLDIVCPNNFTTIHGSSYDGIGGQVAWEHWEAWLGVAYNTIGVVLVLFQQQFPMQNQYEFQTQWKKLHKIQNDEKLILKKFIYPQLGVTIVFSLQELKRII